MKKSIEQTDNIQSKLLSLEKELHDYKSRYLSLVETISSYVYRVQVEQGQATRTEHGPACQKVTGYTQEEYQADPHLWIQMIHPDDRTKILQQIAELLSGNKPAPVEHRIIHKNSHERWICSTLIPFYNESGVLVSYEGVIEDITEHKEAETTFTQNMERYRTIYEESLLGIFESTLDGRILWANNAYVKMYGFSSRDELLHLVNNVGQQLYVIEENRQKIIEKVMQTTGVMSFENLYRRKDGTIFHGALTLQAIVEKHTHHPYLFGFVEDITQRKQTENALQYSEARYRAIVEQQLDCVCRFLPDGTLTYVNETICNLMGVKRDDLIGRSFLDAVSPEYREKVLQNINSISKNSPYATNEYDDFQLPDGTTRCFQWLNRGLFNEKGEVVEYQGVGRDITELKKTQQELMQRNQELVTLYTIAEIAITSETLEKAYNSIVQKISEATGFPIVVIEIYDRQHQKMIFKGITGFTPTNDSYQLEIPVQETLSGVVATTGNMIVETNALERKEYCNPMLRQYQINTYIGVPMLIEGHVFGTLSLTSPDIHSISPEFINWVNALASHIAVMTCRIQIEEERINLDKKMLQTQKLESLGVLAGGIAHDFNNLLMGIIGFADMSLLEISPVSPARDNIENIIESAEKAADLAKQMLAYSGKGRFLLEQLNLSEVISEMNHILSVSIVKQAILKYKLSQLPMIEGDSSQIRQIILNLVTNASDAIGNKSGVITISTGYMECDAAYLQETYIYDSLPEGKYVFVEITDTGCGMDQVTLSKIFDPFFSTKFTGRGLGLAAVLGIIRGHKGAIKVYSEIGRGTTFKVLFPAVSLQQSEQNTERPQHEQWYGTGTILIADDEPNIRAVGKHYLEKRGFTILTAEDGVQAVQVYKENPNIDLIILDLTMPNMDGEQTYRELRRIKQDIRVIMSSGYNEQEVKAIFAGKGIIGFIQKPYRMEHLLNLVRKTLEI